MKPILSTLAMLLATAVHAELPQISDARINQPPPGAPVAAGYFTINNIAAEALVITGASSDQGEIEVHLSEIVDDVATMSEQESITIEPGEKLEFRHGSYHLMLTGMSNVLNPDVEVTVTLETNQGDVQINMPVVAPGGHGGMKDMKKPMDDAGVKMEGMKHEGMEKIDTMKEGAMESMVGLGDAAAQ